MQVAGDPLAVLWNLMRILDQLTSEYPITA